MMRFESFRHLGIWVAFNINDWHEIRYQSFGLTKDKAERRAYKKMLKWERAV